MATEAEAPADGHIPFEDLDDNGVFAKCATLLQEVDSSNFVVDFGKAEAKVAFNMGEAQFGEVLKAKRPRSLKSRWINIWAPNKQKEVVKLLAHHYSFSPRLLGLMLEDPVEPPIADPVATPTHFRDRFRSHPGEQVFFPATDEEKCIETPQSSGHHVDPISDLTHYRLVDEVWHFASVDWGESYLCLGYNSLHGGSTSLFDELASDRKDRDLPKGQRLWSWLILSDDGTVISIYEEPFPGQTEITQQQEKILSVVRRNIGNVFRELSQASAAATGQRAISILRIRGGLPSATTDNSQQSASAIDEDGPGLVFYYLYDDWYSSYGLVARKEQQYGAELNRLRERMLDRPQLDDIDRLHHVGRQLAVLKRIYQSYKLIIDRVLERQRPHHPRVGQRSMNLAGEHVPDGLGDPPESAHLLVGSSSMQPQLSPSLSPTGHAPPLEGARLGAALTPHTIVRFERLRDRIGLYALSEIQECLDTKDALVLMAFNLIAMKESQAVERLARITILLAKVTILFLPVSLMTNYFSVQIADLQGVYTVNTYWVSFGVIMVSTILLLVVFGRASGTVEGKVVYQSLGRKSLNLAIRLIRGRQPRGNT